MSPKCIIIKSQSKELYNALVYKLNEIKNIRFFQIKINGFYTIVIKCYNYYNHNNYFDKNKLYGSYIFLYSIISIILSELLIRYYEHSISRRIINSNQYKNSNLQKLSTISSLLLDENSPFEFSALLFNKRKRLLLNALFQNFRKRNFIFTDYFIDFSAKYYIYELKKIFDASIEILENKSLYDYMMNFIFQSKS